MSSEPPRDVLEALGRARAQWDALLQLADEQPASGARARIVRQWKFYGARHGWQLKLMANGRALAYLIPRAGRFTLAMALRDDAVQALAASGLPAALVAEIEAARPAPEGRPARVDVSSGAHLDVARRLLAIKLAAGTAKRPRAR